MFDARLKTLARLAPLVEKAGTPEVRAKAAFLRERLDRPCAYVLVLGETSSGKSSLVNGLLAEPLLPVGAGPTTGAITEVEISEDCPEARYAALFKDGRSEEIDARKFSELSLRPAQEQLRLKLLTALPGDTELAGLRLFDTPGYGSVIAAHEEVLKDFLPNADFILYVINYKIGFQEEDRLFVNIARDLVRENAPFALVINRVPPGVDAASGRIRDTVRYLSDILHYTPPVFLVPNVRPAVKGAPATPAVPELWQQVRRALGSRERLDALGEAFDSYLLELYEECLAILERRYLESRMSHEELQEIRLEEQAYAKRIIAAGPLLVEPCFDQLAADLPRWLRQARDRTCATLAETINGASKLDEKETLAYINNHHLAFTLRQETGEIQARCQAVLTELNEKLDDYVQKETVAFNNKIQVILKDHTRIAGEQLARNMGMRLALKGIDKYMAAFGGAGGANAGIANAASHALKQLGRLFGKTFSRQTHNALKHFLAKIGMTSMRSVGLVLTLLAEAILFLVEIHTWKGNTLKKVSELLDTWEQETLPVVLEELDKLRETNLDTLVEIANEIEAASSTSAPAEFPEAREDLEFARQLGRELFHLG